MSESFDRKKAASMLGINYRTLESYEKKGIILPIKHPVNGRSIYTKEIINNFLDKFKPNLEDQKELEYLYEVVRINFNFDKMEKEIRQQTNDHKLFGASNLFLERLQTLRDLRIKYNKQNGIDLNETSFRRGYLHGFCVGRYRKDVTEDQVHDWREFKTNDWCPPA